VPYLRGDPRSVVERQIVAGARMFDELAMPSARQLPRAVHIDEAVMGPGQ
jgi:hypothetical protein